MIDEIIIRAQELILIALQGNLKEKEGVLCDNALLSCVQVAYEMARMPWDPPLMETPRYFEILDRVLHRPLGMAASG